MKPFFFSLLLAFFALTATAQVVSVAYAPPLHSAILGTTFVDWDSLARSERIAVLDGATGAILDSQTLSNFDKGTYTVWNVTGHVKLQFGSLDGANAVVSGIFFDPVPVPVPAAR